VTRAGQVVGVAIGRVKPDSLPERLGIQSGDVLLAINDAACSSLEETIAALLKAREAGVLVARMERDGQQFDLEIRMLASDPG
jgi:type II secretory pathway component PulC